MLEDDKIRVVFTILLSVPLCFILRQLKGALRKYYSLFFGFALQYYMYGSDVWLAYTFHLSVYLLILIKGRKCGCLVTVLSIVAGSSYHIYRFIVAYGSWDMDLSTILMGNVCKYSYFAYSYQDGG